MLDTQIVQVRSWVDMKLFIMKVQALVLVFEWVLSVQKMIMYKNSLSKMAIQKSKQLRKFD